MTNNLVIGASGLVGSELMKQLNDAVGTYCNNKQDSLVHLDISDEMSVYKLISKLQPKIIYMPSSLTHVDYCEENPDKSYLINVLGTKYVVGIAKKIKAKIVFFSTDYIFDGVHGSYYETDAPNPLNVYGKHKLISEHYIATNINNYLIIRTSWLFGLDKQKKNFTVRLAENLFKGKEAIIPNDQFGSPTYVPFLVDSILKLNSREKIGIFNIVGPESLNRYNYALMIADVLKIDKTLIKTTTSEKFLVKRPRFGELLNIKVENVLGVDNSKLYDQLKLVLNIG